MNLRVEEHLIYAEFTNLQAHDNKIQDLIDVCHQAAVKKQWWGEDGQKDKSFTEFIALTHSEVDEGLIYHEQTVNNKFISYDDHLPEYDGRLVEIADAVIRIFDWAGRYGYGLVSKMQDTFEINHTDVTTSDLIDIMVDSIENGPNMSTNNKLIWFFCYMHVQLSKCLEANRKEAHTQSDLIIDELAELVAMSFAVAKLFFHVDLERVIIKKVNYNLHRPDKHDKNY